MTPKKRILIVYPHNFFAEKSGTGNRNLQLLNYFKSRGCAVDLLTLEGFKTSWKSCPQDKYGLIDNLFIYDFKKGSRWQRPKNRKKNPFAYIRKKLPFCRTYTSLPDFAYRGMKRMLGRIVTQNHYDYIIIVYVYWANLITAPAVKAADCTTVFSLEDFSVLNRFDTADGNIKIGAMIQEEIRRVNRFDKVICISKEEESFFSRFARRPRYHHIPLFMEKNQLPRHSSLLHTAESPQLVDHDLLFIASDNSHNRKGLKWFLSHVLPLAAPKSGNIKVLIVGGISQQLNHEPRINIPNTTITSLSHVDNLASAYGRAKIAICPLQGGTGMKVKVVEALSFGLPIVTTSKGVIGFPCQTGNGCLIADSPTDFAHGIQRLLQDSDFYARQQRQANDFFKEHFEQSTVYSHLDQIFFNASKDS